MSQQHDNAEIEDNAAIEDDDDGDDIGSDDSQNDISLMEADSRNNKKSAANQKDMRRRLEEKLDAMRLDRAMGEYDFRRV